MDSSEKQTNKWIFNLFLIAMGFTIVFIMFASYLALNINNSVSCSTERFYAGTNTGYINSPYVLTDTETTVLEEFRFNKTFMSYKFCFDVNTSTNNILSIVDIENNTLAIAFVDNTTQYYCSYIDDEALTGINFIGLRCDTCSANEVTIMQETTGIDIKQISTNFGDSVVISSNDPLSYKIFAYDNCKPQLKYLTGAYFFILAAIFLSMLLFIGYEQFRKSMLDGWGDM
jgi:hypothetical protein